MSALRVIPGHPHYMVSESGEVFSIRSNRYLKLLADTNGYRSVNLGAGPRHRVHRLVALTFIPNPDGKPQVNHKDGDRANNVTANLEWVTCSENHNHSYRELTRKKHGLSRPVLVDGRHFADQCEAARVLGVVPGAVSSAASRGHRCKGREVRYV